MSQFASTLYPQTNPTNPILLDIRDNWRVGKSWSKLLDTFDYVRFAAGHYVTKEWVRVTDDRQLDHAHRVLTRLASLSG